MNLPFVSRRAHDAEVAQLKADLAASDAAIAWHQRLAETDRRRYDELLDKYHALKVTGARPPLEAVEPSPVDEAIDAKVRQFGNSTRLRRLLQSFATRERLRGADDDTIIARVMDWSSKADEESA